MLLRSVCVRVLVFHLNVLDFLSVHMNFLFLDPMNFLVSVHTSLGLLTLSTPYSMSDSTDWCASLFSIFASIWRENAISM